MQEKIQRGAAYVIYSANESATSDGAGFWSNIDGWTVFEGATRFAGYDIANLDLPVSVGGDAKWCLFENFLLTEEEKDTPFSYFAVTGRIPGDDEDTVFCFPAGSKAEAISAFDDAIYALRFDHEDKIEEARDRAYNDAGVTVFVISVMQSNQPIEEI